MIRCIILKRVISDSQRGLDEQEMKNMCCDKVEQKSSCGDTEVGQLCDLYMKDKGVYI